MQDYRQVAAARIERLSRPPRVLLCGVTPELVTLPWPEGTRLVAIDRAMAMVELIWVGRPERGERVVLGDWRRLPAPDHSFDLALGDGVLNTLSFPAGTRGVLDELWRVLSPGGVLATRVFVVPEPNESPKQVLLEMGRDATLGVSAFKWRVAMALQEDSTRGVSAAAVLDALEGAGVDLDPGSLAARTGWPRGECETLEAYRGSTLRYFFPTEPELRSEFEGRFEVEHVYRHSYPLGERCATWELYAKEQ